MRRRELPGGNRGLVTNLPFPKRKKPAATVRFREIRGKTVMATDDTDATDHFVTFLGITFSAQSNSDGRRKYFPASSFSRASPSNHWAM